MFMDFLFFEILSRAELKVTDLKVTEPNLRFPAFFCENLRLSALSCALQMLHFPGEGANLPKSAVFCKNLRFGLSLSP